MGKRRNNMDKIWSKDEKKKGRWRGITKKIRKRCGWKRGKKKIGKKRERLRNIMFFGRRINEIEKGKRKELGEVTKNKEKEVARRESEDKGKHLL